MLNKLLKEIIGSIAGKPAEEIVDLLDGKKYINEFLIAKKLDLTINQTRNILYKISDQGLVSSIRKKDKKKGWYTYFWKIEILKSLEFLEGNLLKKIDQVNHQIKSRETKEFYVCENCNIEFNEEKALLNSFTCNECGNIVSRKDNSASIKEYNKELDKLRRELSLVQEESNLEKERLNKIKEKEIKKEEKEKEKEKKQNKIDKAISKAKKTPQKKVSPKVESKKKKSKKK